MGNAAYSDEQTDALQTASIACSVIALGAALVTVATFWYERQQGRGTITHELIVWCTIGDSIRRMANLYDEDYPYARSFLSCQIQATIKTFGHLSTFTFIIIMAYIIYKLTNDLSQSHGSNYKLFGIIRISDLIIEKYWQIDSIYKYQFIYKIITFIFISELFFSVIPFFFSFNVLFSSKNENEKYQNTMGWCGDSTHDYWRFMGYIPMWLTMIIVTILYTKIIIAVKKLSINYSNSSNNISNNYNKSIINSSMIFLFTFIICFIFGTFRRLWNVANSNNKSNYEPPYIVTMLQVISNSLYALCNCLAYYYSLNILKKRRLQRDSTIMSTTATITTSTNITEIDDQDHGDGDDDDDAL